jgi:3-deoxy-7-phosphoheptulonate synthase
MIIPKEPKLTVEQLSAVTAIVEEYDCKLQVIVGHHRSVYAVLGEERKTVMVNRILGLDFIDRFDAVDSPFKLMDSSSELAQNSSGKSHCGRRTFCHCRTLYYRS